MTTFRLDVRKANADAQNAVKEVVEGQVRPRPASIEALRGVEDDMHHKSICANEYRWLDMQGRLEQEWSRGTGM